MFFLEIYQCHPHRATRRCRHRPILLCHGERSRWRRSAFTGRLTADSSRAIAGSATATSVALAAINLSGAVAGGTVQLAGAIAFVTGYFVELHVAITTCFRHKRIADPGAGGTKDVASSKTGNAVPFPRAQTRSAFAAAVAGVASDFMIPISLRFVGLQHHGHGANAGKKQQRAKNNKFVFHVFSFCVVLFCGWRCFNRESRRVLYHHCRNEHLR